MKGISIVAGIAALASAAFYALPALTAAAPAGKPEPLRVAPPAPRALPAAPASMSQVQLTFAPVVKRIAPAVVNVYARTVVQQQVNPFFNDPLFSQLFGSPEMRQRVQQSLGSGVIVRADGLILTNNHVVAGGNEIIVALADKREFKARVLLADPRTDLAVLKIDPRDERLPVVPFGDSDAVQVGDLVLAIGDPFGVGQTVTMGIVSALARTQISASDYQFFIQTDAAINPGNSGGALVTTDGKLAGINTAIYSRSGGSIGIGFAIPVDIAREVMTSLIRDGEVTRGWIGVQPRDLTPEFADSFQLPVHQGVLVTGVLRDGPAARAGLKPGDVVTAIGGMKVSNTQQLLRAVGALKPPASAALDIQRGSQGMTIVVAVAKRPQAPRTREPETP